ncbi:MAG: c-type cytochrome [Gammaproteobacteria bacterium]
MGAARVALLAALALVFGTALALDAWAAAPSGKKIVAEHGCAACHGAQGQGTPSRGRPRLAGQPSAYLLAQLEAFADGRRRNAVMNARAKQLDVAGMRSVADYYAALETPSAAAGSASSKLRARGRGIVANGAWQKNLPSCEACHGPGARGIGAFPALAGQNPKYLAAQLEAWQTGKRPGGPDDIMGQVAKSLSTSQVRAVAAWLASLPATGPIPKSMRPDVAPATADALAGYFQPPLKRDVPKGQFGEAVKRGYLIFTQTPRYAADHVGNGLTCQACHVNGGRQANSSPMWAAWGMYPAYRSKNKKVNDFVMRLQGCFEFSENAPGSKSGHPPAANSKAIIDLESYIYWMSRNVPTGKAMKGRGYPDIAAPPKPFSRSRGHEVYATHCAVCHGGDGQGRKLADGRYAFPPLWGPNSYNWGAGMHGVNVAAAFIHANMPLGNPGILSVQDVWDVAAWIDSHPRPQDPRFNGDLEQTINRFHSKRKLDYYGKTVDGYVLGAPGTLKAWLRKRSGSR